MVINTSCHCTQQWTLDWTLSCFMPLHSAIFVIMIVVRAVAFVFFFLVFGHPHALCHSNCFLISSKLFFSSFSSFWLGSLDPVMPNAFSVSNFFVIFVKTVVSVIFLEAVAIGRFYASRKHSAIFMLCLSVSLTTSDYL